MIWQEHITVNPLVMHGKACLRGTRIPVAVVLVNLAEGLSPAQIILSYPSLTHEAIQAAFGGAEDPDIGARCQAEGRVLFTLDLDFADIRTYPPSAYIGIVVFRPVKPSRDGVLALPQQVIPVLKAEWSEHRL